MTNVRQVNIGQEMREAYLDYAMSVIVARALPDARDGLKPVHRRILYAMYDMGIRADTAYKKCARIVGEVLGKYHPHGDSAVYESLVRMAQEFSMRGILIDGQGNFGSIDGDGAAAMRYTEARTTRLGDTLMTDIDMETVDFVDNFDGTLSEPSVMPSAIPNLLVNGSSGIAVGMSTNIPPHNLGEVCDALQLMLSRWDMLDELDTVDLMRFIKGPDFPTGGLIYYHDDDQDNDEGSLVSAYATGRGKITMRARVHLEDMGRGKQRIIVSEIPFQVNKSALIERIANLVRDGRIEGIADLRDESDRQGLRLMVELQRGAEAAAVLNKLFQLTPLQETFSIIMLALVNNEPRFLSLKHALKVYLDHRLEVVRRRSEFELRRMRERAHILEGLLRALSNLDEVISIIRRSRTPETARNNLIDALKITEIQAQAILDMQLRRLAALERKKLEDEYQERVERIAYLQDLLGDPAKMRAVISEELALIKTTYSDKRRTIIVDSIAAKGEDALSTLVPQEDALITMTVTGRISRGVDTTPIRVTADTKEPPRFLLEGTTLQTLYLFSTRGQCATIPVQQIPQAADAADGAPFRDLCGFKNGEQIAAALCLAPGGTGYIVFATRSGEVKRLRLEDMPGMMANPFKAIDLDSSDQLVTLFLTAGEDEIVLTTAQAISIRFKESDVRPTGLGAGGMRGIKLGASDRVVAASIARDDLSLWIISEDGIAKSTPLSEYPAQGRAGAGVATTKLALGAPALAAAVTGKLDETLIVLTSKARAKSMKLGTALRVKRAVRGDYVFSINPKEKIEAVVMLQRAPREASPNGKANGKPAVLEPIEQLA